MLLDWINSWEYINIGYILIFLLLIVPAMMIKVLSRKSGEGNGPVAIAIIFLCYAFVYEPVSTYRQVKHNIKYFSDGNSLKCHSGWNSLYSVSKQNNWKVNKNYFLKDSLLIRADKCKY